MTQPIQEPGSVTRTDAKLTWGSNQLFRRPSPTTSAGGLGPWIWLESGGTTSPAVAAWMPIPFVDLLYDPALVTQGDIFDWTITDAGDPGNDRFQVRCVLEGWYYWELVTFWDQVTTDGANVEGYAVQRAQPQVSGGGGDYKQNLRSSADWPQIAGGAGHEMVDDPYLRGTGVLYLPGDNEWKPEAKQTTGSDRGLSGDKFLLVFLGVAQNTDWTFETV